MLTSIDLLRVFLDDLGPFPIEIADGLSIIEVHASGSIVVNVFVRRVALLMVGRVTDGKMSEVAFEGPVLASVASAFDIAVFSLPYLHIRLSRESHSFEVTGRGRLELHGPAALGANSWVLDGELHVVDGMSGQRHMRLDFHEAIATLPIAGGMSVSVMPRRLLFAVDENGSALLEMRVTCGARGLPRGLREVFDGETFDADMSFTEEGVTLQASTLREGLAIPLPAFEPFGGSSAWHLEEMTLSAKRLCIQIGREVLCSIDIRVGVPAVLCSVLESHIDLRLTSSANDVRFQLLSSPFRALECTPGPKETLQARLRFEDGGEISFVLPEFHFDWTSRCVVAEGRLAHQDLRIPMAPVRSLLERAGMHVMANHLPEAIPVQSFGLTQLAPTLTNLAAKAFHPGVVADKAREALDKLLQRLEQLPKRLRDDFLHVDIPKELAFRIECTFDFDARFHVAPSNDKAEAEASPLRLLVPLVGQHGPELVGLTLYRLAFGEFRAGQAFTVEIDAEVDRFELLPIALATTLDGQGRLPSADDLQSRLLLRDVTALLGISAGVPWIVPLSFRTIGLIYTGIDGIDAGIQWGFSAPHVDMGTLMRLLVRCRDALAHEGHIFDWPAELRLECSVGPAYLRFPKVLGGQVLGSTHETISMDTPAQLMQMVSAVQTLDMHRLLDMIPPGFGARDIDVELGPTYRHALEAWTTGAEPALFFSTAQRRHESDIEKGFATKFRGLTSALTRGLGALHEDKTNTRVRVHLERVTPQGIEVRVLGPDVATGKSQERRVELLWNDFWGSAGRLGPMP